jgi:hypothetical protein
MNSDPRSSAVTVLRCDMPASDLFGKIMDSETRRRLQVIKIYAHVAGRLADDDSIDPYDAQDLARTCASTRVLLRELCHDVRSYS